MGKLNMREPERSFLPLNRQSGAKTPDRIVIAFEGEHTEPQYFHHLAAKNSRISIVSLERAEEAKSKSAPKHVLQQLHDFKAAEAPRKHDELWLVVDVDQWENLTEVVNSCSEEGYRAAISNPCFELWLLLHFRSLDEYTAEEKQRLWENKKVTKKRTFLEKELSDRLIDGYNKRRPATERFIPFVKEAIERARQLDTNPNDPWPQTLGTRVYLLAERILRHKLTDF